MRFGSNFGGPCDVPASETCEKHTCPHWWSDSPIPVGDAKCRDYMRMKRRGLLTTAAQLAEAKRRRAIVQKEIEARKQGARAADAANLLRRQREREVGQTDTQILTETHEETAARVTVTKGKTKKFFLIGGIALVALGVGGYFLSQRSKKRTRRAK